MKVITSLVVSNEAVGGLAFSSFFAVESASKRRSGMLFDLNGKETDRMATEEQ